jgi:NAD-dependent deacetylase
LAQIETARPGFFLATQNVDGLHVRAGSRKLVELHGNIRRTVCFEHRHPAESWAPVDEPPPRCAACGSLLRPDVVWFGEALPAGAMKRAQEEAMQCDLFLSIGTSTMV